MLREARVIFAVLALALAVASLRVMTPSLMPPAIVRDTLAGWEVPVAAA